MPSVTTVSRELAVGLPHRQVVQAQPAHQRVAGRLAFAGQQRHRGALQQRGVGAAQAARARAPAPATTACRCRSCRGWSTGARAACCTLPVISTPTRRVQVGPQRQHVQARVVDRAAEERPAAFDVHLLAVGGVGAADGADGAVDRQLAARRGQPQLPGAAACPGRGRAARSLSPRSIATAHLGPARRARGRRARRPAAGGAPGRRTMTSSSSDGASPRLTSNRPSSTLQLAVELQQLPASAAARASPLTMSRRSMRPSTRKRSAVSASCTCGAAPSVAPPRQRQRCRRRPQREALDRGRLAVQAHATSPSRTFTPCSRLRTPRPLPLSIAGDLGRAEAAAEAWPCVCSWPCSRQPGGTQAPQTPRSATRACTLPSSGAVGCGPALRRRGADAQRAADLAQRAARPAPA